MRFPAHPLIRSLQYVLGLFEVLLAIRLVLRFLDANPAAGIVDLVYKLTEVIILPFKGIFANIYLSGGGVLDTVTLSAMIGYPVIAYILVELLQLAARDARA